MSVVFNNILLLYCQRKIVLLVNGRFCIWDFLVCTLYLTFYQKFKFESINFTFLIIRILEVEYMVNRFNTVSNPSFIGFKL